MTIWTPNPTVATFPFGTPITPTWLATAVQCDYLLSLIRSQVYPTLPDSAFTIIPQLLGTPDADGRQFYAISVAAGTYAGVKYNGRNYYAGVELASMWANGVNEPGAFKALPVAPPFPSILPPAIWMGMWVPGAAPFTPLTDDQVTLLTTQSQ